jgi:hypothetical protein
MLGEAIKHAYKHPIPVPSPQPQARLGFVPATISYTTPANPDGERRCKRLATSSARPLVFRFERRDDESTSRRVATQMAT